MILNSISGRDNSGCQYSSLNQILNIFHYSGLDPSTNHYNTITFIQIRPYRRTLLNFEFINTLIQDFDSRRKRIYQTLNVKDDRFDNKLITLQMAYRLRNAHPLV